MEAYTEAVGLTLGKAIYFNQGDNTEKMQDIFFTYPLKENKADSSYKLRIQANLPRDFSMRLYIRESSLSKPNAFSIKEIKPAITPHFGDFDLETYR